MHEADHLVTGRDQFVTGYVWTVAIYMIEEPVVTGLLLVMTVVIYMIEVCGH